MEPLTKELRRTGWMALLVLGWGLAVAVHVILTLARAAEPYVSPADPALTLPQAAMAIWLGAQLTWGERDTWSLLLTRPISRRRLMLVRLGGGAGQLVGGVAWPATKGLAGAVGRSRL